MIFRKIGKILLGEATPPQLILAAVIGALVGFLPGLMQAPGLFLFLFLLALLLNANFALIGITTLAASILSVFLMPVSFAIGRFMLEGPLQGLFAALINAPVTAFFGFEYYAVTGGIIMGVVFGLLAGWGVVQGVTRLRRKLAGLQQNSEKFNRYVSLWWVRILLFVFAGGAKAKDYAALLEPRKTKYLRPFGLVAAAGFVVLGFVLSLFTSDAIVSYVAREGLQKANGATVDLEQAELRLREGRLTLTGLAMADPNDLNTDLLRAAAVEGDIDTSDLLRKRFHIKTLRFEDASTGEERRFPGQIVHRIPERERPPKDAEEKTLEDYLEQAEVWRERLEQARHWLEKVSRPEDEVPEEERPETRTRRIAREIEEKGYGLVKAEHLIEGVPTVLISYLAAEKMRVAQMPEETIDVIGENLSTHPRLVDEAPSVRVASSGDSLFLNLDARQVSRDGGDNHLAFYYRDLSVERFAGNLRANGRPPIDGGLIDVSVDGPWRTDWLDLPLEVTLRDTRINVPGVGETDVERVTFPLGVTGPLNDPRIHFDSGDLASALADAGKAEVARRLQGRALEELGGDDEESSGDLLDAGRGFFQRDRDE